MIKIVDIADEIWRDILENPDYSIAYISFWLRYNIGKLNSLLLTSFTIDPTTLEINSTGNPFSDDEKSIFKMIWMVYYYGRLVQKNLFASQYDRVSSVADGDGKITKVSLLEIAKTASAEQKQITTNLLTLSNLYRYNRSGAQQVVGTDNIAGWCDVVGNNYYRAS